ASCSVKRQQRADTIFGSLLPCLPNDVVRGEALACENTGSSVKKPKLLRSTMITSLHHKSTWLSTKIDARVRSGFAATNTSPWGRHPCDQRCLALLLRSTMTTR
ncbi:unnamed protein product, partial [Ectocarpus sp. 12 AP-2014]